jgi:hypothetical protein
MYSIGVGVRHRPARVVIGHVFPPCFVIRFAATLTYWSPCLVGGWGEWLRLQAGSRETVSFHACVRRAASGHEYESTCKSRASAMSCFPMHCSYSNEFTSVRVGQVSSNELQLAQMSYDGP